MAYNFQVVFDCHDPHGLAEWWAETLGWHVEPQDAAFILSMIEQGHATEADTHRHKGALVWREGAAITSEPEGSEHTTRIYFQQVPEAKNSKNRVHLDLRLGADDPAQLREALVARGATILSTGAQGSHTWAVMADPEGNEFCV